MTQPVFIIGWGRSGTTWLGNLLQQHSKIAAVSEPHRGIFESAWFSEIEGRYGDLSDTSNFIELSAVLSRSIYMKQAGADMEFLLRQYPAGYTDIFINVMDRFAQSSRCTTWVEKTPAHTLLAERIARTVPGSRFIGIERDLRETILSRLQILEQRKKQGVFRAGRAGTALHVVQWILTRQHYKNRIKRLSREFPDRVLRLRFEDLKQDTEGAMRKACDFLGLEFEAAMTVSPYRKNSSRVIPLEDSQERFQGRLLGRWLDFWQTFARIMPPPFLAAAHRAGTVMAFGAGRQALPHFFFEASKRLPRKSVKPKW